MHVAHQLSHNQLHIEVAGTERSIDDLLPDYERLDRFGIVINRPLGSLGASLLIQAAIVQFYRVAPERTTQVPQYPEIYVFHVGGRYGDHSNFDFWPPRKEIFLPDADPIAVLEAVNDRGITRLALPDGPRGDLSVFEHGPSTWAEQNSARGRLASCFAYDPSGQTPGGNIVLRSSHRTFEDNVSDTLDPIGAIDGVFGLPSEEFQATLPGPSVTEDAEHWRALTLDRIGEVPDEVRQEITRGRLQVVDGVPSRTESYRTLDATSTLRLLAAC